MWFLIQGLIVFAVVASNIYFQWSPNPYIPAALGAGAAYILTDVVNELAGKLASRKQRRAQSRERNVDLRRRQ